MLGSLKLFLKGMRRMMFQYSGFYCTCLRYDLLVIPLAAFDMPRSTVLQALDLTIQGPRHLGLVLFLLFRVPD